MASTSDIKKGLCMELNGDLFTVVEFLHVKPGKGPAFVRTKLKNVSTGRVIENTFPSGRKINEVRIERRPLQYLYKDEAGYNFMHTETYEQINIPETLIEQPLLLKEGIICEVVFHAENETPLTLDLPMTIVYEVVYSEPGIRGDTATNTLKPATLDTGAVVMVPIFVETGDKIRVDTRDGSYMERVKE